MANTSNNPVSQTGPNEEGVGPEVQDALSSPNPFDPKYLALRSNPAEAIGVHRALVQVPVRKPNKQEFVRVHPDTNYRMPIAILKLETENEVYAVTPDVAAAIPGDTRIAYCSRYTRSLRTN